MTHEIQKSYKKGVIYMKKMIILMMVVLGMNTFAARDNGMDRDMRSEAREVRQQENQVIIAREPSFTLNDKDKKEMQEWIHGNMTRKSNGSHRSR